MEIVVGICGASGVSYSITLLEALKDKKVSVHLIISKWAKYILKEECNLSLDIVKSYADYFYENEDLSADISSSSNDVDGMVIIPATVKTISHVATANTEELITRVADNMLRLRRPLIIAFRETPISTITIENLYKISIAGGIIFPLSPGFYYQPKSIEDMKRFIAGKILDLLGIKHELYEKWKR